MDEEEHLSFFLEWYDPQSDQIKPYILHYYGDQTLELIERKTRRVFLKRIRIPTVNMQDLFVGASLSIYSRQLTVIEAANEYTKSKLQKQTGRAMFIVTPGGYRHMGKALTLIERAGLQVTNTVLVQFDSTHLPLLQKHFTTAVGAQALTRDVSLVVEATCPTPGVIESIRAGLSSNSALQACVHISTDCRLEQFPSSPTFTSTAVLDNCTLCLIRPHVLRDGGAGVLLDEILGAGFEVSALRLVHFRMCDADEFFRVYKGIYRQYQEVLKAMCASPCIALEVRGEDVVRRFRELCGPHDVEIAKALRPTSLRARFGKSTLHNAVHCTDCPEDGAMETQFVFSMGAST